jgi:hypothetical protein
MSTLMKYWQRILQMDKDELVRVCYICSWLINNVQYDTCAKKLEKELNKIGLGHVWQNSTKNQRSRVCKEIKQRCNHVKWQNVFTNFREKRSLIFYCEMKL